MAAQGSSTPATAPPAPTGQVSELQPRGRDYNLAALELLRAGVRPTADNLVARLKGSKTTAHNALNAFWESWLPSHLGSLQPDGPEPLARAMREVWAIAMEHAEGKAVDQLQEHRAALERDKAALAADREQLDRDRAAQASALVDLRAEVLQATAQRDDAVRDRALVDQRLSTALDQAAAAAAEVSKLQVALEKQRAAYIELQAAERAERSKLEALAGDLKGSYLALEQRLLVELDAERTARKRDLAEHQKKMRNLEAQLTRARAPDKRTPRTKR